MTTAEPTRKAARQKAGRRSNLTRNDVVVAAIELIDEDGLDGFTMRALAERLNVYPTALYWHAGSKSELLAAASSRVLDDVRLPDEHQMAWDEWVKEVAHRCRHALHRHPEIAMVAGSKMVVAATAMPMVERLLGVLERAGFQKTGLLDAYNTIIGYILGWTTLELSAEPAGVTAAWREEFASEMRDLDPNAYPAVTRNQETFENNAFMMRYESGRTRPMDRSFTVGLDAVIRGLATQLEESSDT
ncbi:TetR/AcrR family transcriptional regulator C-terminal domain-containing protein [Dactylosporangium sp. CA-233914]|uniref:TetR/AcrR family transcriptional regulator C-terminal domain-containing protein n=1 Tax=Dactylosporangium sp. CA-233914 TaxID=3239934 RepID=UPI003D90AF6D